MFEKVNNRYALRKTKKGLASLMIGMLVVSMGTTVVGATGLVEDGNIEETHSQVETDAIGDIVYFDEPIDYESDYYPNPSLEFGEHVLEQAGHHGTKSVEYIETEEGYVPTGVETIVVEPQNDQVAVGNLDVQYEFTEREVEYVEDPTLPLGETRIIRDGRDGELQITLTYEVDPTTGRVSNPTEEFIEVPSWSRIVGVGTLEVEETPELLHYTLMVEDGNDITELAYDAETYEEAEQYFHDYVAQNFLDPVEWSYNERLFAFTATIIRDETPVETDTYTLNIIKGAKVETVEYDAETYEEAEEYFENHVTSLAGEYTMAYDPETLTFTATLYNMPPSELDKYILKRVIRGGTDSISFYATEVTEAELHFKNHINGLGLGDQGYFEWTYDAETLTFTATFVEGEEPSELDTYTLNIIRGDEVETVKYDAETYEDAEEYFENLLISLGGEYRKSYSEHTLTFRALLIPEEPVELDTYTLSLTTSEGTSEITFEAENAEDAELHFKNHVNELGLGDFTWTYDAETLTFTATFVEEEPEVPVETDTYTLSLITSEGTSEITFEAENAEDAELHFKNHVNELGLGDFTWTYDAETLTFTATFVEEEPEEPEVPVETETYRVVITTPDTVIETSYDAETVEEAEEYFRDYANRNGLTNLEWTYDAETLTFNAVFVEDEEPEEPEVPVEHDTYKLNVITPDTRITTEIEAEDATAAEQYFRNYVNRNGLGDLVWSYDAETLTFTAILEETPEEPEEPETPGEENPEEPETPETPEVPEVPETPETPVVPETPETPEKPEELPPLGEASSLVGISSVLLASGLTIMLPKKGRKED